MPRTKTLKPPKPPKSNGTHPEKKPPVDLAALFRRPTAVLKVPDLRSDDMADTGIRIEVAAFRSDESARLIEEYHAKLQALGDDEEAKQALLSEGLIAQLVTVTKRWWHEGETTDGIYYHGELLACTPENKRMVYTTDGWQWLRDFVVIGFMRERNFFGEPPKTA